MPDHESNPALILPTARVELLARAVGDARRAWVRAVDWGKRALVVAAALRRDRLHRARAGDRVPAAQSGFGQETLIQNAGAAMLVDLYRDLIGRSPHDAMLHATLGTVWEVLGRSDSAVAEYREAIRLDANAPRPHTALGNLLLAQGKLDGAAAEFREAIRAEPTDARLHDSRNRGRTPGGVPFRRAGRGSG